ncbi:hypothetical protein [Ammoniphilus sp. YIM 78166]|nr:hypothetical protein [Ammoniphilus sp. YIM 78166]
MPKTKWFSIEKSKQYDYVRDTRFIITVYKILGIPFYKRVVKWH